MEVSVLGRSSQLKVAWSVLNSVGYSLSGDKVWETIAQEWLQANLRLQERKVKFMSVALSLTSMAKTAKRSSFL